MVKLLRRRLRCHGCGEASPSERPGVARAWVCPYCEAANHVDERGQITDPPVELTAQSQPLYTQPSRSGTPDIMHPPVESPFCERCEKNQLIVNRSLAEYLPDEHDPQYTNYEKALPQYQAQLEERYPPVCENCIERVQAGIRQAGYATKAEELRRKLDQSKKYQKETPTVRQTYTLWLVWLGRWAYITSAFVAMLWHSLGAIAYFDFSERDLDWAFCLSEAMYIRNVHQSCVASPPVRQVLFYALAADLLTIWWNPKLRQKMKHASGRMHGLVTTWMIRMVIFLLNAGSYLLLDAASIQETGISDERVDFFRYTHMALLTVNILATLLAWNTVTIKYVSTKELLRPLDAHLPIAPRSTQTTPRPQHTALLPNNTSFDSMAAGFASSFPSELNAYPPSPTLSSTSYADTEESDFTPYTARKSSIATTASTDAMDWTPTHSRFGNHTPPLLPFPSSNAQHLPDSPSPSPSKPPPVNIFKPGAETNPFRRRIPAAPTSWHKATLPPHPEERKRNFFAEDAEKNRDLRMGLSGRGVPKGVEREASLFQAPQFKYDAGGLVGAKETGLEDGFNDLFSK